MNLRRLRRPRRVVAALYAWTLCATGVLALRLLRPKTVLSLVARRVRHVLVTEHRSSRCRGKAGALECRERSVWAVLAAGRRVPGATCLVEAMVAQILLARCGACASVRVGVRPDGKTLHAHAWLELDGEVLLGGEASPERFAVLPDLPGEVRLWR